MNTSQRKQARMELYASKVRFNKLILAYSGDILQVGLTAPTTISDQFTQASVLAG